MELHKLFISILAFTALPGFIGWSIAISKTQSSHAFEANLFSITLTVIFLLVGAFLKYKFG